MCDKTKYLQVKPGFAIPHDELHFSYAASSGPGGQNVNKTATKVFLKWWPLTSVSLEESVSSSDRARLLKASRPRLKADGAYQIVSSRFRTQEANRRDCMEKLAQRIRTWLQKPKKRIPTKPTRAAKERRLKEKKRIASIKKDRRRPEE